jgi:hypothetical protein
LLHLILKYRIPAVFCALAVLICELIARPYVNMGICDDGPYILVAKNLAATGHIVYNGWSAAMLVWQLYLAAGLIKLFGFSFTTVRLSTLLVAVALAFFLQRVLVLAGITERNATLGTLALVLSPLYLLLSATFMSDIHGLFGIVLCLYGCLRALRSSSNRSAIAWLCLAVAASAITGTSRQLTWLGVLVMVPCTLWLLRDRRRVVLAGAAATFAGVLFILGCMIWLSHQPYTTPEKFAINFHHVPMGRIAKQFLHFFLDIPFLLLPVSALFLPQVVKSRTRATVFGLFVCIILVAAFPNALRDHLHILLEPASGDWVSVSGGYEGSALLGAPPDFLAIGVRAMLSVVSLGGCLGLIFSFFGASRPEPRQTPAPGLSQLSLAVLVVPYAVAYLALLVLRAVATANEQPVVVFDRYALGLLVVATLVAVRYFQDRFHSRFSIIGASSVAFIAALGIIVTHNNFAFYRARVDIISELSAAGVSDTSVDGAWEHNVDVELRYSNHVNNSQIALPRNAYTKVSAPPSDECRAFWYDATPHIHPLYGIAFDPNACYGVAPFAPVHYSRWLASKPGTLYVVKYHPPSQP